MTEVSIHEAKAKLSALLKAVADGEEIVITNRNRPVAKLVPIEKPPLVRPIYGSARKAFEEEGRVWDDADKALNPISDDELKGWGIA